MMKFLSANPYFETGDWLIIAAYLVGIIALGVWLGRGQKNTRDYFLGSKNIPWWGIGLSIVAAETSALTIIGVPGMAYATNLGFIQMVAGYVIARIILAVVMVPHYLKGEIYSPYQLFADRLGAVGAAHRGGHVPDERDAGGRSARVCGLHPHTIDAGHSHPAGHRPVRRSIAALHLLGRGQGGDLA